MKDFNIILRLVIWVYLVIVISVFILFILLMCNSGIDLYRSDATYYFLLWVGVVYCFYKNNIYKKKYSILIFILGIIMILAASYKDILASRYLSLLYLFHPIIGRFVTYPIFLIYLSTIFTYITYKRDNEQ